ncbi:MULTISPECIES: VWA domain-containing protein [unclassified Legionella]|uniref:vWA domain-containing protein n=1 Tax=unclassified Legionella TaxID=2622702 RepID=UPI001055F807|nr:MULTISPECIES: VWA domain-containing protein [unclassified Legionella]MDI9819648.1 VWA domain-containing protein [Legionella sp. PL877]
MMTEFHFLRPWWLVAILPLLWAGWRLWCQNTQLDAWGAVCDQHLLRHLMLSRNQGKRHGALLLLLLSGLCMIISLAGPSWSRLPVPTYQQIQPNVLILDLSDTMLDQDLSPDRLSRAKFKLHDLFRRSNTGQFGLVVYTGEPFVVSPLTEDAKTIDALVDSLSPDIMPVRGQRLDSALDQAARLISQAGFHRGKILVLTGETPDSDAIDTAKVLAEKHIFTSVMPIRADASLNPLFQRLASAGQGRLVPLRDDGGDLQQWLESPTAEEFKRSQQNDAPVWRDEGRWFLLPALMLLLPAFRRGWLQRIAS